MCVFHIDFSWVCAGTRRLQSICQRFVSNSDCSTNIPLTITSQGTQGGGNRFPGVVAAPFAMVKLGPDVQSANIDAYSGYLPQGKIFGFSMMHESGTGGAPKYGVVSQMPVVGEVLDPLADLAQPRASPVWDITSLLSRVGLRWSWVLLSMLVCTRIPFRTTHRHPS
jgi:hypothetical protein